MAIEIVDFPIKDGDFPLQNVSSPEATPMTFWDSSTQLHDIHDFQALLESCVLLFWGISLALIEVLQLQAKGSIGSLAKVREVKMLHVMWIGGYHGISMGYIYIHIILYNFIYIYNYMYIIICI